MIDLREKDRVRIEALAKEYLPEGSLLWAYGSRVKGQNHEASDLDLCAEMPNANPDALTALRLALQDSNIPIFVQVMDWHDIPESFRENILKSRVLMLKL